MWRYFGIGNRTCHTFHSYEIQNEDHLDLYCTVVINFHILMNEAASPTAKPLSGDGLQWCPVTFDQDGLPRIAVCDECPCVMFASL